MKFKINSTKPIYMKKLLNVIPLKLGTSLDLYMLNLMELKMKKKDKELDLVKPILDLMRDCNNNMMEKMEKFSVINGINLMAKKKDSKVGFTMHPKNITMKQKLM